MEKTALEIAIEQAGSQTAFAREIGASQQIVSYWLAKRKALPAEYVLRAEAAFGVSRHDLRPDIYPSDHAAPDTTSDAAQSSGKDGDVSAGRVAA